MADLSSRITSPPAKDDAPATAAAAADVAASNLAESEYDVEVTLSELQNNENTPFHSANTWDQLGL